MEEYDWFHLYCDTHRFEGCRERGETCLANLSLTAPRLFVQKKCTPLMCAVLNKSKYSAALAKVLIRAGAEVNAADNVSAIGGH